jgi:hypothetical protein
MAEYLPILKKDKWFTGKRYRERFIVTDDNNALVNMTGWSFGYVVASNSEDKTPLLNYSGTVFAELNIVGTGTVDITVSGSATQNFTGSDFPLYYRELRRIEPGNDTPLAFGPVVMRASPTPTA